MTELPTLSAEFIGSAASLSQCPQDDVVEIAFVGRSNAGKSSTLNRVMANKRLARVSKTPGRTRLINLFSTSWGFRVVDLLVTDMQRRVDLNEQIGTLRLMSIWSIGRTCTV